MAIMKLVCVYISVNLLLIILQKFSLPYRINNSNVTSITFPP